MFPINCSRKTTTLHVIATINATFQILLKARSAEGQPVILFNGTFKYPILVCSVLLPSCISVPGDSVARGHGMLLTAFRDTAW